MRISYDPHAHCGVEVRELPFRRTAGGRQLMARVYQPLGPGPFPVLLDLHGGAWNTKDRFANETMDRAIAASGVLVVAIDLTLAPEAPYPGSVQDAHYGVRWLKWKGRDWNGDPATVGILGSSTGGHLAELLAMRPDDARYGALALPEAPTLDATVCYVATRSPISDPYARFLQAQKMNREPLVQNSRAYFQPWDTIHEANPQEILERGEAVRLPPLLILQGALDDNVPPALQERFAAAYRAAGGECRLEIFEGCGHLWIDTPGSQTDRAHATVKQFIAHALARAP